MTKRHVECGYLPLVDSAPLIIAKELQFAAEEGLDLSLVRQPSWSALRDMLALGHLDFAHMLSPMPVAMSLGLGGMPAQIDALMVLSVNGTVIGVSADLNAKMQATGWRNTFDNPRKTATALFASRSKPLRVGVPFPFSMHRLLLDYWLTRDPGFQSDHVEIITVPPPQMAAAVQAGTLDIFCVGEPWGSVAVQQSEAVLILPGNAIWQFAPEKVLGARHDWVDENPDICRAMIRAVYKATTWLEQPQNAPLAIEILTRSQHLGLPDHAIDPALTGDMTLKLGDAPKQIERFVRFHGGAANFPWRSQASWIAQYLASLHNLDPKDADTVARRCFRSDLYRSAIAALGADLPGASEKVEGALAQPTAVASTRGEMILGPDTFFDGAVFDNHRLFPPKK
ncbi:CmpA/NrtA family ABC transporter substrate-binding protein [Sulfitobacter sp. CW3]|uniref:CmpA/NrtA family ABC transporter substrate-binding protein n=1 Tax=Sulfitobacter sp. CW3 TaxID=2861965 RepID=UPI001C5F32D6|nr:CmpA/NrtA family ABC transporter substrate-binding protein [Sulfitobacter sp. CW3]MBW4960693.1 ABC transporter substrate-binding protein [Sulfitobacter sp. CW3]